MWTNGRAGTEDGAGCSPLSSALPAHLPWVWISRQSLHVAASAGSYPKCTTLSGSAECGGTLLSPTLTAAVPCRQYRQDNISVNLYVVNQPWLFSVLWCSGVSSVTTNACQVLKEMKHPIWLLVSDPSILHPAPQPCVPGTCGCLSAAALCSCLEGDFCSLLYWHGNM